MGTFTSCAPVSIADEHATLLIDLHIHEVEQIAANICAAGEPDAAALDWIVRSRVNCLPGRAAVVGGGDIEMPYTIELRALQTSRCGCAQEGERSAVIIARDHRGEDNVINAELRSHIERLRPGDAFVGRCRDNRFSVAVGVPEINPPDAAGLIASPDADGRVTAGGSAARHSPNAPVHSIIFRHHYALRCSAALVR